MSLWLVLLIVVVTNVLSVTAVILIERNNKGQIGRLALRELEQYRDDLIREINNRLG